MSNEVITSIESALGVSVEIYLGEDGTPVVLIDSDEELDGEAGPEIRVRLNHPPLHSGRPPRNALAAAEARRELAEALSADLRRLGADTSGRL
jgi:hypothetical protein